MDSKKDDFADSRAYIVFGVTKIIPMILLFCVPDNQSTVAEKLFRGSGGVVISNITNSLVKSWALA